MLSIGVLGAGVVGLSTAVQLQESFPSARVVIVAERFYDQTTSFGAAGIFRPSADMIPGTDAALLRRMTKDSWKHYDSLIHSTEAAEAGVQILSGYRFTNDPLPNELEQECLYNLRPLTHKEQNMFPGEKFKYGWFLTSIVVEPGRYLPYLLKKFQEKRGVTMKKKIHSLEEFVGHYDVVVNCLGLGSREVCNDKDIYPVRGHLLKVRAPWLKHFVYTGEEAECYIIPGIDVVSIGGTRTAHDYGLDVRREDTEKLMKKACSVVPSLEKAELLSEWVGLRPTRNVLRIERETIKGKEGCLKVVHNYGHGGTGVGLSWGSAMVAVELVKEALVLKASL